MNESSRSSVMITGSNGQLGRVIATQTNRPDLYPVTRADADLSNRSATQRLVRAIQPTTIIHLAAGTDLNRCENDEKYAWEAVALPAINIAFAAHGINARVIMMSTDYVYSGSDSSPVPPSQAPHPINKYGCMKLVGEAAVQTLKDHAIVRGTFKDPAARGHNSEPTDAFRTYNSCEEMGRYLLGLIDSGERGIIHFPGEHLSMYNFEKRRNNAVVATNAASIPYPLPLDLRLAPGTWADYMEQN